MKLSELKSALIEQFFTAESGGVSTIDLPDVHEALAKVLKVKLSTLSSPLNEGLESICHDATKGFKKFTDGRRCILSIMEEDKVLFAAARSGRDVAYSDLTVLPRIALKGDLSKVKMALRQAKNLNDDAYFSITNKE